MPTRENNVVSARWSANGNGIGQVDLTNPANLNFGSNVFDANAQRQMLPKAVYRALQATIERSEPLDPALADAVALGMKDWALGKGATHFTHWFQPLTGSTAEKHDSFYGPVGDGTALAEFSGKELIQGEPDASSFPTGGVRATFEARGYTAWDPTSPAFIVENPNGSYLSIPTAFASWTGEALDTKIPLLRSMEALSKAAVRALRIMGDDETSRVFTTIGAEQEYFLIDKHYFYQRPDLVATGRTLYGAKPAKGQELDDHYFGYIAERVLAYMLDVERELAKLGVPIKTRHNEVAPGQYEVAPMFENSNLGTDHQQLCMQVMQGVAKRYDLVCLLHEKPFAGVNGSGKHNNWSMATAEGENLLEPGDTPHENMKFLFFSSAVIRAVDIHQGLLRASVGSAGQDHRLGANEAPPAIMSIFLGSELEGVFEAIASGTPIASAGGGLLGLGTPVLPDLPMHGGDRNRTSPFAFTGNKFEFRALGSSDTPSFPNTVLNTIAADSIDALAEDIEAKMRSGTEMEEAVREVIKDTYKNHGRIVFGGDNYSEEWEAEAARRGLLNLKTTVDALPELISDQTVAAFSNYGVLNERELESRHEVRAEQYVIRVNTEAETAADIARTMILPATVRHLNELKGAGQADLIEESSGLLNELVARIKVLEEVNAVHDDGDLVTEAAYMRDKVLPAMASVREVADRLERIVANDLWPLPKYQEMLLIR
jgi:glutamine synthetase